MSTLLIEEARSALARAGLEFERRQLLSIFDSIDEIVYVSDPETYEVLYANRAIQKEFGDIVGRKCYEALQGFSEPCSFCTNDRIFGEHDGEAYVWEFNNTLDGRWYRCIDRAIRWPNGKAVRYEMAIDITERKAAEAALRQTSEYLESLLNHANAPIIVWDAEFKVQRFNHAFERLTGYGAGDIIDRELSILFPEETREESLGRIERTLSGEYWESVEVPILRKDGSTRVALWNSANIYDEDGETIIATIAQGQDITERTRAEEALRKSEKKYRLLYDNAGEAIFSYDSELILTDINRVGCEAIGYSREEMLGKNILELNIIHPRDLELAATVISRHFAGENVSKTEYTFIRKDGSERLFSVVGAAIRDPDGNLQSIINMCRDITERKEAEKALRESEEKFRQFAENLPEAVFEADSLGKFVYVNANGLEVFDYTEEELYSGSLTVLEMIAEEDHDRATQGIQKILSEGPQGSNEYMARRKDGSLFPAIVSTLPVVKDGITVGLRGVLTDMTAQKEAEEALRRANEELKGYAHTVSHDLKSPLSAVAMAAEMLSSILEGDDGKALEGNADEVLRVIGDGTRRAVHMTENVLALAQAGQAPAIHEPVDISGVLRSILKEKEALLKDHGVRVSLDDDLGVAAMDPTLAYQLFENHFGNSIKYNDSENPEIHISRLGEAGPGRLRYLVRDNGPGIPEGAEEDIFLPFHKGPNSTDTGIGLSIVDKVVRLYGGQIRAYSDGGACFEFTLPLYSP